MIHHWGFETSGASLEHLKEIVEKYANFFFGSSKLEGDEAENAFPRVKHLSKNLIKKNKNFQLDAKYF